MNGYSSQNLPVLVPASEKQVAFLKTLLSERKAEPGFVAQVTQSLAGGALTKPLASEYIGTLLKAPKATQSVAKKAYAPIPVGYYANPEGTVFEVVANKSNPERRYANMLVLTGKKGKWVYKPGALAQFKEWVPVTLEAAQAFGKKHSVCCICGRTLTKTSSIEAGIGPICASKF